MSKQTEAHKRLTEKIEGENDLKLGLTKQVAEVEAKLEKLKADLVNKEKLLASRQKTLNQHVANIRQYESDKKIKNERLRFLTDKSDSLKEQLDQDKKSNERAAFSIQSLSQERVSAEKQLEEQRMKLSKLEEEKLAQQSRTQTVRDEVETVTQILSNKQEEVFQINKTLEINEIQISALKQQLEKAASDTSEQSASLIEFEKRLTELTKQLQSKRNEQTVLQQREEEITTRSKSTETTIGIIKDEIADINRKLDARQNEYNLTKSLVENLEGFPEAIKFLQKQKGWNKSASLLSDIITTKEEYRVSIENYLEPYLNYYIVETEAEAYKAINLLSDAARGKAHFFVLDTFNKFSPSPTNMYPNAFPASEIVEYEDKYRNLIMYILDEVYMTSGDEKDIPQGTADIFITQSGKVTKKKFSISGGSVGLFEGKKIGRAKNLEKLEKEIKNLQKQLSKVSESLVEKQDELESLQGSTKKEELEALTEVINQLNEEHISLSTKQEQFSELISSADLNKEDILNQIEELSTKTEELRPKVLHEEQELATMSAKQEDLKGDLQLQNELLSEKSSLYNQENILFHQKDSSVKSLNQEIEFKQSAFNSSKERIEKNQEELDANEKEIKLMLETSESSDEDLIKMYSEKETIEQGVNEAEKDYYQSRGNIDETEKEQRELQHKRESIDSLLLELHNTLNETKLELASVKERLSVEFEVDLDKIMGEESPEVEESEDELEEKVTRIKSRIDNIGPINPMAMEAYDEIKERHQFITQQKEDLNKAKESLLTTIDEIDLVAKTTFLDAFGNIKENFIKVFRSLFTEQDDCDLFLSDPENPLESSIEITAKPKGKRPLTINQLSGGEKTLTATSLLFAIYLLKPAPFCIFDEVDAPLDDANIDKFNNIIKTFSKDSQFIIVTHNKRTMASTDIIYGITMIEQGVSRVVPVDLRELA